MKGLIYIILGCVMTTQTLFGLKHEPSIPALYEFEVETKYCFSYFSNVANAYNPSKYSSHVNQFVLDLGLSVTPSLFIQFEVEFDETSRVDFNLESVAPYIGYQVMNDLTGDYVTLLVGGYFRYVPKNRLIDVATPYSGEYNFDIFFSVGKEFDREEKQKADVFAYVDAGWATVGNPYMLVDVMGSVFFYERNKIVMGIDGFYGFGADSLVNVNNFFGYGNINHSSLDVKVGYEYDFLVWGKFQALYRRRVIATAYPEYLDGIDIKYTVNFSF